MCGMKKRIRAVAAPVLTDLGKSIGQFIYGTRGINGDESGCVVVDAIRGQALPTT